MIETGRAGRWARAVVCAAAIFLPAARCGRPGAPRPSPAAGPKSMGWILVDVESFFCGACLDPLLEFCRAVPARVQEDRLRAILVFGAGPSSEDAEIRARIVKTKWQGFSQANGIRFPALADADRVFRGTLKTGAGILIFAEEARTVRWYPLPLSKERLEEVLRILID